MSTQQNLSDAFAGESQANRKYLAFAKKADSEGLGQVAKLFRAAAEAETVHAHAHLRAMSGIKSTLENLNEAAEGEGFEFKTMYPPYLKEAQEEGQKQAEISFRNALIVEEVHHDLYTKAIESVKGGSDLPQRQIFICTICGNTVYDNAEERCSVCGAPQAKFQEIA